MKISQANRSQQLSAARTLRSGNVTVEVSAQCKDLDVQLVTGQDTFEKQEVTQEPVMRKETFPKPSESDSPWKKVAQTGLKLGLGAAGAVCGMAFGVLAAVTPASVGGPMGAVITTSLLGVGIAEKGLNKSLGMGMAALGGAVFASGAPVAGMISMGMGFTTLAVQGAIAGAKLAGDLLHRA